MIANRLAGLVVGVLLNNVQTVGLNVMALTCRFGNRGVLLARLQPTAQPGCAAQCEPEYSLGSGVYVRN
jgi:hypothetical protein